MGWTEHHTLEEEWMHNFIHILDIVPMSWYVQQELRCATVAWMRILEYFLDTFKFESKDYLVNCTLNWVRDIIFSLV